MQGLGALVSPVALLGRRESRSAISADDPGVLSPQSGHLTGCRPQKGVVADDLSRTDRQKLTPLLRLKYHDSIVDAVADLRPEIGQIFGEFQKYLYLQAA